MFLPPLPKIPGDKKRRRLAWLTALSFAGVISLQAAPVQVFQSDANGNLTGLVTTATVPVPVITGHPQPMMAATGGTAVFSVSAGPAITGYQWRLGGNPLPGATGDTLRLTGLTAGQFGNYDVVVTNAGGSATSVPAALTLDADGDGFPELPAGTDTDGDRLPDDWEMANFNNLTAGAHGDADDDGVSNIDEFTDGTNPRSNASRFLFLTLGEGIMAAPARSRYGAGSLVTLTAAEVPARPFIEWSGHLTGLTNPASLTMDADKSVTALRGSHVLDRAWQATVTQNDGGVYRLLPLASGKIFVAGRFSVCNGVPAQNIAWLNADLTFDPTFAPRPGVQDQREVWGVMEQADGKIVIAGTFDFVNGVARRGLARLWPDGTLDPSFNPTNAVNGAVYSVARLSDGRLVIGGAFTQAGGVSRNRFAVLSADGVLDASFDPGEAFNNAVNTLIVDTGDTIICGGRFTQYRTGTANRVARILTNGTLDASFNAGGSGASDTVDMVKKLPDGRTVVSGAFPRFNDTDVSRIVILNADGTRDASFNPGQNLNNSVFNHFQQADGKLMICGAFNQYGNTSRSGIARLNADGSLDATFNPGTGANNWVFTMLPLSGGRILMGGWFSTYASQPRERLTVIDGVTGAPDQNAFTHAGLRGLVWNVTLQNDGKLLAGGDFVSANGLPRTRLARFLPGGQIDGTFVPVAPNGQVYTVAVQRDGKILASGAFAAVAGVPHLHLVRLLQGGAIDPQWHPAEFASGDVYTVTEDGAGRILAGGTFNNYGTREQPGIVRLLSDGTLDTSFTGIVSAQNAFYDGWVDTIALQPDGKLVIGGSFGWASGAPTTNIARLNPDGTADDMFNANGGSNGRVRAIVIQPDGRIVVGGEFTRIGGQLRSYIARLLPDGQPDATFGFTSSGGNNIVYAIKPLAGGRLLVCGEFSQINGIARRRLAMLEPDGSLVEDFNPGTGPDDNIYTIAADSAGDVYAGGWVREIADMPRAGLLRLTTSPGVDVLMTSLTPASPVPAGTPLSFSATASSTAGVITGVRFEAARNGADFSPIADGTFQGGTWNGSWTPPASGTWHVRAMATDLLARTKPSFAIVAVVAGGGWDAWQAQYFTPAELNDPSIAGPNADPDQDGQPNLAEYAAGTGPRLAGEASPPLPALVPAGGATYPALVFRFSSSVSDVTWSVEVSSDLATWSSGAAVTTLVSDVPGVDGIRTLTVRDNQPAVPGVKRYLRLRLRLQIP